MVPRQDPPEWFIRDGLEVEASVARCLRTPPYSATRKDFDFGTFTALRGNGDRSIVVVGNY